MSHRQASFERGYSVHSTVLEQYLNEKSIAARRLVKHHKSIAARRLVKHHMLSNNLQPHNIEILNKMIINVISAHQRY